MNDVKNFLQSRTIWAAVAGLIISLLAFFHKLPADLSTGDLTDSLTASGTAFASMLAIVFRVLATKQVTILPTPPSDTGGAAKAAASMILLTFGISAIIILAQIPGCAQSETNRAAQGMILVQTHAKNVKDLAAANAISVAEEEKMDGMVHDEQAAVNGYYAAIQSGDSAQLAQAKAILAGATSVLETELAKYKLPTTPITLPQIPATTTPTTTPATAPSN